MAIKMADPSGYYENQILWQASNQGGMLVDPVAQSPEFMTAVISLVSDGYLSRGGRNVLGSTWYYLTGKGQEFINQDAQGSKSAKDALAMIGKSAKNEVQKYDPLSGLTWEARAVLGYICYAYERGVDPMLTDLQRMWIPELSGLVEISNRGWIPNQRGLAVNAQSYLDNQQGGKSTKDALAEKLEKKIENQDQVILRPSTLQMLQDVIRQGEIEYDDSRSADINKLVYEELAFVANEWTTFSDGHKHYMVQPTSQGLAFASGQSTKTKKQELVMDWKTAIKIISGILDGSVYTARDVIINEITPFITRSSIGLGYWIINGKYSGDETPRQLANEWNNPQAYA